MVHKYKKKNKEKPKVNEQMLQEAIAKVQSKQLSIRKAAAEIGMPESSLRDKMKKRRSQKPGTLTSLPEDSEKELAYLLKLRARWGFGASYNDVQSIVQQFVLENRDKDTELGIYLRKYCQLKVRLKL